MHEVCSNSESFDDTNDDENSPYGCKCEPIFKEDSTNLEEGENNKYNKVPELNVLAHNQLVFAHNFTSIQIECREDNNPCQIDKVPVETEVFDSLCVLLVPLNRVGLEDHVEHDQQSSEDVNTVCTGCHIED